MADKIAVLTDLLTPIAQANGVEFYDIEIVREGGEKILRLFIDKMPGGVDLEDCERTSRAAEAVLDEHDIIPDAYVLEVSSPGIERKLTRDTHFTRYIGHEVRVRLYAPQDGRKNFRGKLTAFENNYLTLTLENEQTVQFTREAVAACKLAVFED